MGDDIIRPQARPGTPESYGHRLRGIVGNFHPNEEVVVTLAVSAGMLQLGQLYQLHVEEHLELIKLPKIFQVDPKAPAIPLEWSSIWCRRFAFRVTVHFTHQRFWKLFRPHHFENIELV